MTKLESLNTSSGILLPLLLRRKWMMEKTASTPSLEMKPDSGFSTNEASIVSNRVFTSSNLEERITKTAAAMVDIQKQVHRGEESYYDDTYSHGNLFRGWDAFVDAKDVGTSGNSALQPTGRRIPGDFRWFSGSCRSLSRTTRPLFLTQNKLPIGSSSNDTPVTVNSSLVIASDSSSPSTIQPGQTSASLLNDKDGVASSVKGLDGPSVATNKTKGQKRKELEKGENRNETRAKRASRGGGVEELDINQGGNDATATEESNRKQGAKIEKSSGGITVANQEEEKEKKEDPQKRRLSRRKAAD